MFDKIVLIIAYILLCVLFSFFFAVMLYSFYEIIHLGVV
jgi:hypothetical protein